MSKEYSRTERIAELMQRELALLIQHEIKDPRLPAFITVSAVKVTHDFSHAKIYITVLGEEADAELALSLLKHAAGYLRSCLANKIKLRTMPQLHFVYDDSLEYGNRLSKLIDDVVQDEPTDEDV